MPPVHPNLVSYRGAGIYSIVNVVNGKVYVGSAMAVRGRQATHRSLLRGRRHYNKHLQSAWDKYGEKGFRWRLLEKCGPSTLESREQHWIDTLKASNPTNGYNICPTAYSPKGLKQTEEANAKRSAAMKAHPKEHLPKANRAAIEVLKGKKRSDETKEKISKSLRGRSLSDEHKRKVSDSCKKSRKVRLGALLRSKSGMVFAQIKKLTNQNKIKKG